MLRRRSNRPNPLKNSFPEKPGVYEPKPSCFHLALHAMS